MFDTVIVKVICCPGEAWLRSAVLVNCRSGAVRTTSSDVDEVELVVVEPQPGSEETS
jgi:hypothetical protein